MEVADRLLRSGRFQVGRVSLAVGYLNHETFLRAYKVWAGELPSEVGAKPCAPEIEYTTWRRVCRAELNPEEAREFLDKYLRVYPGAGRLAPESVEDDVPEPVIDADGDDYERFRARQIWRRIRDLPAPAQRRWLRQCDFRTPALFDLLREVSRREGRRDRRRGVEIARLALDSLEGREEVFGERIHDLRTLGHVCLGYAHALAINFPAADAVFVEADRAWRVRRPRPDLDAFGEFCLLKGTLRMYQRAYEGALGLVNRGRDLFGSTGNARGEIRCLIQSASIHGYAGRLPESIAVLREAEGALDARKQPYLAFAVSCNLAISHANAGSYAAAGESLSIAKRRCLSQDHPLGSFQVQYTDGFIQHGLGRLRDAETLYLGARYGFTHAGEPLPMALVALDLSILYAEQERWADVLGLAAEAVPLLQSLRLYPETLAAVKVLAHAVRTEKISSQLLLEVSRRLRQDPMAQLSRAERAEGEPPAR